MNVLLVGLDSSILATGDIDSDTRQRHIQYAEKLASLRPGSHVYMIVQSVQTDGLSVKKVSDHLTVIPSDSITRELFLLDILKIGRCLFRETGIDLVTTQTPFDDGLAGYLLARRYGCAFLAQLRPSNLDDPNWLEEEFLNRARRPIGKFVCRQADGVRVVNKAGQQWCSESLGLPSADIYLDHIVMSMLDTDRYPAPGRPTDLDTVLFVGRLATEKDLPTLLRAFARVHNARHDCELVVVGDGPERDTVEAMVDSLGLGDAVSIEGSVPYEDLPAYYDRAGTVVLSSRRETFGRVILEAFAYGTPVVATAVRGPSELIEDGETGVLVPTADPDRLATAILEMVADAETNNEFGEAARTYVTENFDPDALAWGLVETWVEVAEARAGR
jgi:glycosyltransferase involved in cell wall biosynthesis